MSLPGGSFRYSILGMAMALGLLATSPAAAQSLTIEQQSYYPGQTVVVHYSFPALPGRHSVQILTPAGIRSSSHYTREGKPHAGTLELPVNEILSGIADTQLGITVQIRYWPLRQGGPGTVTVERYLTIVNDVTERPESLSVPGRRFTTHQVVRVDVQAPTLEPWFQELNLLLYRPPLRLEGGAILPAQSEEVHSLIVTGEYEVRMPAVPGRYELHLVDSNRFVLARAAMDVELHIPRVTLKIDTPAPHVVGSTQRVAVEPVLFPRHFTEIAGYTVVPDRRGGWTEEGLHKKYQTTGTVPSPSSGGPQGGTLEAKLLQPGPHRLVATWGRYSTHFGRLLAGSLEYEVEPPSDPPPLYAPNRLEIPQGPVFRAGDAIEVTVDGPMDPIDGPMELRLYRLAPGEHATPAQWKPRPEPALLTLEFDSPEVLVLPTDLEPGDYEVHNVGSRKGGGPPIFTLDRFTVLPEDGIARVEVSGGGRLAAQHPYTVEVTLPPGLEPQDRRLAVHLVHLGGELPGCHTIQPSTNHVIVLDNGQTRFTIDPRTGPLVAPGEYEARLYFGRWASTAIDYWPNVVLLATDRFEVEYEPLPGTLGLPAGSAFWVDNPVPVSIALPDALSTAWDSGVGGLYLQLMRLGEVAESGAVRHARVVDGARLDNTKRTHEFTGSLRPGAYGVRLLGRGFCLLGECRDVLLDAIRFTVRDPTWRGPLTRLPGTPGPDDLQPAPDSKLFPPIGLPGSCGDRSWLPPPDDVVEIRFVRNIGGDYVPFEESVRYGEGFYVEARVASIPVRQLYGIQVISGDGQTTRTIAVRPTQDDPKLLRSAMQFALWPQEEE